MKVVFIFFSLFIQIKKNNIILLISSVIVYTISFKGFVSLL